MSTELAMSIFTVCSGNLHSLSGFTLKKRNGYNFTMWRLRVSSSNEFYFSTIFPGHGFIVVFTLRLQKHQSVFVF